MATAYESDSDTTPAAARVTTAASLMSATNDNLVVLSTVSDPQDATVTCIPAAFYPKGLCCSNQSEEIAKGTSDISCSDTVHMNGGDSSNDESDSNMVSILSEYYTYVEDVRQELQERNKPVEQVRLSLQYLPCLTNQSGKQLVFSQSSSIFKATDVNQLLMNLNNVSSWYNYGLMHHLSATLVTQNGTPSPATEERKLLNHSYFRTLELHHSDLLSLLPSVSTGPQVHEDFEEIQVFVSKECKLLTLKDVINIHRHIADVLGLRMPIVLFQGVSEKENKFSELVFWIPKSVAALAMKSAYNNQAKMPFVNIAKIQSQYVTIAAPAPKNMRESGYGTTTQSNDTIDDDNGLSSIHSDKTMEEDEVFITQVSPDDSSMFERVSNCTVTESSSRSLESTNATPIVTSNTPILIPPTEYTIIVSPPNQSTTSLMKLATNNSIDTASTSCRQIHLDTEILQEIDRQNSISSPLENTTELPIAIDDQDAPYVAMNPAPDTRGSSVIRSNSSRGSQTPSQNYSTISSKHNPHYQTPPRRNTFSQLQRIRKPPTRIASFHHYRNIPISYIRVPKDNPTGSLSPNYRIVPPKSNSRFVKRILLRSSDAFPINIHMIVISNQESNKERERVMVESGERVTALYALQDDIVVKTSKGTKGKVPYSSCRISKTFYGSSSKIVKYVSVKLYSISTLCIEALSNNSHSIPIYVIVIKPYCGKEKDELTVLVGDHLLLLFSDENWVFGRLNNGKAGFVPRDSCRLVRRSLQVLSSSGWVLPSLLFQSDFVFSLQEPPPSYLLLHYLFPKKEMGAIVMVTQAYTPPGTQVMIRRGVCVKTIYCEEHFKYVATISGSSFWIPAPFTVPAPKTPSLPNSMISMAKSKTKGAVANVPKTTPMATPLFIPPVYSTPVFRDRSNASCSGSETDGKNSSKKKVSFNPTVFRRSMGSNPELNAAMSTSGHAYSSVIPPRRVGSNENIPVFMLLNDSPVLTNFCGCFNF